VSASVMGQPQSRNGLPLSLILHIAKREQWKRAQSAGVYRADTLDADGFIHCSTPRQVVEVANTFFRAQRGLVLLCIASGRVRAEIRYEGGEGGEQYPHIYGPLNLNAITGVLDFEPGEDGAFELPPKLANLW
jgi:uncharacterized protein (DUF952 family)